MSKLIRTAETKENNKKREPIGTFQLTKSKAKDTEKTNRRKVPKNYAEQNGLRYIVLENNKERKTKEETLNSESLQNERDLNRGLSSREKGSLKDASTSNERTEINCGCSTELLFNPKMTKTHNLNKQIIQVRNQALEKRREEKRREEKRREEKRREEKILLIRGEAPRKLLTIINIAFSK